MSLTPQTPGSGSPGFKPCLSHWFLDKQETLLHFVSLHLGVIKGTGDILLGFKVKVASFTIESLRYYQHTVSLLNFLKFTKKVLSD